MASSLGGNLASSDAVANSDNRMSSKSGVVLNRSDDYFSVKPSDLSWNNVYELALSPASVITNHSLVFEIPRLASPNFVFANDLQLQLSLRLVDAAGNKPDDNANVSYSICQEKCFFLSIFYNSAGLGGQQHWRGHLQVRPDLCGRRGGQRQPT